MTTDEVRTIIKDCILKTAISTMTNQEALDILNAIDVNSIDVDEFHTKTINDLNSYIQTLTLVIEDQELPPDE